MQKLLLLAAALVVFGCSKSRPPAPAEAANPVPVAAASSRLVSPAIDPELLKPYDRHSDPDLYTKFGDAGLARINRLRVSAAEAVGKNPDCGKIDAIELMRDEQDQPEIPFRVWIDCDPVRRFYFSESDIGKAAESEYEKGRRFEASAVGMCVEALKHQLVRPSSMALDIGSIASRQATATGNWIVLLDFKSQSAAGIVSAQKARCTIGTAGDTEAIILDR